jgi:hypothetical protein
MGVIIISDAIEAKEVVRQAVPSREGCRCYRTAVNAEQISACFTPSTVGPAELDDLLDTPMVVVLDTQLVVVLVRYSGWHFGVAGM